MLTLVGLLGRSGGGLVDRVRNVVTGVPIEDKVSSTSSSASQRGDELDGFHYEGLLKMCLVGNLSVCLVE